jgi:nucleotide-binding universal stress UspA family protein
VVDVPLKLIIGHRGHSGIWGRLLGTTADKVVDHAPCSVLVVR